MLDGHLDRPGGRITLASDRPQGATGRAQGKQMTTTKNTKTTATATPQTDRNLRSDDVKGLASQVLVGPATEQEFSTGSLGYRVVGKAVAPDGVRYQMTIQAIRIGTKPAA